MDQLPLGVTLRAHARFETFEAGANARAVVALRALASGTAAGALWIAGGASSGKTHLLLAFCAECDPRWRVAYVLAPELVARPEASWRDWRGFDALCIDDLHAAIGTSAQEHALFALYRDVEDRGARLVVAADRPPGALTWALPDLASRFGAISLEVLRPLEEAQQRAALQRQARARGLELPEETARWLQRRAPRDLRVLCELLDRLDAAALQAQRRLTVPFARHVLG